MMAKAPVDLVFSGGGTLAVCEAGAYSVLVDRYDVKGVGGTSAGSILAASHGAGMKPGEIAGVFKAVFGSGEDLLDRAWWPFDRFGIYNGDRIHRHLKRYFPMKMKDTVGDIRIIVCDLWTRQPVVVSAKSHPEVYLHDAVRCSISIPVFFKAHRLEPGNARLYVDGGVSMNFAHSVFDDTTDTTIGVTLASDNGEPRPVRDLPAYAKALTALLMYSSNQAHLSRKSEPARAVLSIKTAADGLDFTLSPHEVAGRYASGVRAAVEWVQRGQL